MFLCTSTMLELSVFLLLVDFKAQMIRPVIPAEELVQPRNRVVPSAHVRALVVVVVVVVI